MGALIYVSGPIQNDPQHRGKFAVACQEVSDRGDQPLNPLEIGDCSGVPCIWPGKLLPSGHTWQCYMRFDIARMVMCDGIYMMRGWEQSEGAREEHRIAVMLGMDVTFQPGATVAPPPKEFAVGDPLLLGGKVFTVKDFRQGGEFHNSIDGWHHVNFTVYVERSFEPATEFLHG